MEAWSVFLRVRRAAVAHCKACLNVFTSHQKKIQQRVPRLNLYWILGIDLTWSDPSQASLSWVKNKINQMKIRKIYQKGALTASKLAYIKRTFLNYDKYYKRIIPESVRMEDVWLFHSSAWTLQCVIYSLS